MVSQEATCQHLQHYTYHPARVHVCQQCIELGDTWVHLRVCQTCGAVNCCDSSKNKHASKHYHSSSHAVVISAEAGERWAWCYKDELFQEY